MEVTESTGGETCERGADISEASCGEDGVASGSCAADSDRSYGKLECAEGLECEAFV